jgi:hypothetical protein
MREIGCCGRAVQYSTGLGYEAAAAAEKRRENRSSQLPFHSSTPLAIHPVQPWNLLLLPPPLPLPLLPPLFLLHLPLLPLLVLFVSALSVRSPALLPAVRAVAPLITAPQHVKPQTGSATRANASPWPGPLISLSLSLSLLATLVPLPRFLPRPFFPLSRH